MTRGHSSHFLGEGVLGINLTTQGPVIANKSMAVARVPAWESTWRTLNSESPWQSSYSRMSWSWYPGRLRTGTARAHHLACGGSPPCWSGSTPGRSPEVEVVRFDFFSGRLDVLCSNLSGDKSKTLRHRASEVFTLINSHSMFGGADFVSCLGLSRGTAQRLHVVHWGAMRLARFRWSGEWLCACCTCRHCCNFDMFREA
jgi:hypothetical protein